ncbi:tetratricopeptide repeat protein [Scytonema sp. UIC 10036]|uniref:CHAT domain-containing tetratricopeptide repeat protein n=1 Tax=Scytonema sp. UIC 10036 TaxID=2304196 RepID=UPI0012DAE1EB|nr:CHAT domain-containing tetratricopeptide repeat protein [Scytonema sp. UIC 10036]MUG93458.1 tetratricopeptide repeat protein [Scytonema sp. UIC 10036]
MRSCKLGLGVFICLLAVVSTSLGSSLPIVFGASRILAQTTDTKKAEADRLLQQGREQYKTSEFEAALKSWQQALYLYREIKDRKSEGKVLNNLGIAHRNLGEYAKAIEYYQQALTIARQIKDLQVEGKVLGNLGVAYRNLGNHAQAIKYYQQDLTIARQIKDPQSEGQALGNLGAAYLSLGDYAKGIEYNQQALKIARQIKDLQSEGTALVNLGTAYNSLGEYEKAIDYHQQALTIARQIKNPQSEGTALDNLGTAYNSFGEYEKAIDYHQQALTIARQIKNPQGEGNALGGMGNAYRNLGDYAKAIDYHQQALTIARQIKNPQSESQSLVNLGNVYYNLGDYAKAIEYNQQALTIAHQIKDPEGKIAALSNLGIAYNFLGNYAKAIDYYQQVLAIARQIKNRQGEGKVLGNLGNVYTNQGNYTKATEYHQQNLTIARQIKDHQSEGKALGNLGNAYANLGDYAKAIKYYQQHLTIARQIKDSQSEGNALNNLGAALEKSGKLPEAEKILLLGIEVWESQRQRLGSNDAFKVSIFEGQTNTYRILQSVLIAQNKTDRALEIAEQGRGRAFVELLASQVSSNSQEQLSNPPNIDQIKQIAKSQNATLVQYSIITDEFKVAGRQKAEESELYIWVIKPTGEVTFRKADLKPLWQKENINLEELVKISRQSIGVRSRGIRVSHKPNPGKAQNNLKRLHQLLINPIADLLPKKETDKVIFIPQNSLFLVPFPALQDKDGKYLIEKHTILTSPSIQVLDLTRQQRQKGRKSSRSVVAGLNFMSSLIVGNPTMPKVALKVGDKPQQLTSLPGAEKEAKAIASLFNTQALIGNNATEAAIVQRLPQARIIHFATHGLFDDIRGLDSAIALAPSEGRLTITPENISYLSSPLSKEDKKDDGLLTAEEIFDMKINADLVVLSACDTGRGRITGDGVIGLSRSLISAGTPSVIVSLWAVDDGSTAFLMTEFYQNLQQSLDKATALRNAMLTTKKKYSNPSQWAAFTLIGESE